MKIKRRQTRPEIFRWWQKIGPGFITGSADDDPSGIATYTQVGARYGYGQMWAALFLYPLMLAIQEMVARIGLVTGQGLAAVAKKHYPRWLVGMMVGLLVVADTINIGADIGAMADAVHINFPGLSFNLLTIMFAVVILTLEIYLTYRVYAEILKWLCLSLLSYFLTLIIVTKDWVDLFWSLLVPKLNFTRDYMIALVAVFGTTISPYLFFWQASEEVEEMVAEGVPPTGLARPELALEIKAMREDTALGMFFSQFIMLCIVGTAASVFWQNGLHGIETTTQAVEALAPLAGRFAAALYAVGVVGVGLLAVPVLSAAIGYAVAEYFGWQEGLWRKFYQARLFYLVIIWSTLVGMAMNWLGINPIKALFGAAVINGVVSIPLIWLILRLANDRQVVGPYRNGWWSNLGGGAALVLAVVCVILILVL